MAALHPSGGATVPGAFRRDGAGIPAVDGRVEALAVVAYRQPVSRGQVGEIRGVDSDHALRTLERRGLIREIGRAPGPGQAALFATTEQFLEKLGLNSVAELPPLADHVPPAEVVDVLEEPLRGGEPSTGSTS